jgi:hypothetical protein
MGWPFSRLRTYLANSTPSIKAADLNAIQDAIAQLNVGAEFGDGSDGDADFDGVNTYSFTGGTPPALQRDVYFNNLTVRAGQTLRTNGYRFFVLGTCTIEATGKITSNGTDASADTHGVGGNANALAGGGNGGDGVFHTGADGGNGTFPILCTAQGGDGGNDTGHFGGSANPSLVAINRNYRHTARFLTEGFYLHYSSGTPAIHQVAGGSGGGGGASAGGGDGVSGGGGGGGGVICAGIRILVNDGSIEARGGNGADATGSTGGGGGGGGGAGGFVGIVSRSITGSGTITAPGGLGGAHVGAGASNGANGNDGQVITMDLSAL